MAYLPGFERPHVDGPAGSGDCWYTPAPILEAVSAALGAPWFDPCGDHRSPAAARCSGYFDIRAGEDGLELAWPPGPAVVNPPFSIASRWIPVCSRHAGPVIALLPLRAEGRAWFAHVWPRAGLVVPAGRIRFVGRDGELHGCGRMGTAFACWRTDHRAFAAALRERGIECVSLTADTRGG